MVLLYLYKDVLLFFAVSCNWSVELYSHTTRISIQKEMICGYHEYWAAYEADTMDKSLKYITWDEGLHILIWLEIQPNLNWTAYDDLRCFF
jgi:hypothetical protein